jgi:hypothetical protein
MFNEWRNEMRQVATSFHARCYFLRFVSLVEVAIPTMPALNAQDLALRAYVITPVGSNAITVNGATYRGSINIDGILSISDVTGTFGVPTLSYYHAFGIAARSANFVATRPYALGMAITVWAEQPHLETCQTHEADKPALASPQRLRSPYPDTLSNIQLQCWRFHCRWRQLPERFCCMSV